MKAITVTKQVNRLLLRSDHKSPGRELQRIERAFQGKRADSNFAVKGAALTRELWTHWFEWDEQTRLFDLGQILRWAHLTEYGALAPTHEKLIRIAEDTELDLGYDRLELVREVRIEIVKAYSAGTEALENALYELNDLESCIKADEPVHTLGAVLNVWIALDLG